MSITGVHKPHASAYVCYQDNVDRELYGSYFTNAVVHVVLQIGEKTWNLIKKVTLGLGQVPRRGIDVTFRHYLAITDFNIKPYIHTYIT